MMRVAFMVSGLPLAGTERNVVSVLPYIRAEGIDPCLVTMNTRRDGPLADEFAGLEIPRFDLAAKRMLDPLAFRRFTEILKTQKIDLLHAEDQDSIIFTALAHHICGIPTIMTRHVLYEANDNYKEKLRAQLVLLAARRSFNRIITVSEAVACDFAEKVPPAKKKIVTIYNGLPVEHFSIEASKSSCRARLGWEEKEPVVIMVAALRRGKGHEVLFDAIPNIIERIPSVRFVIVGAGEIEEKIRKQSTRIKARLDYLGERSDIPELLKASDVLVLPSWAEALPTVLIEAGAASLPAVATDVGGTREILLDRETGYVIPKGDSHLLAERLTELLTDRDLAHRMGHNAHIHVTKTFFLKRQAERTAELYREVLV